MFSINQPIKHTKKPILDLGLHTQEASIKIGQYLTHSGNVKFAAHWSCWCKEKNTGSLIQSVYKPLQTMFLQTKGSTL